MVGLKGSSAATSPDIATTTRCSSRHAVTGDGSSVTDGDSLAKEIRRKAVKNDLNSQGTYFTAKSFIPFSTPQLYSKLFKVGINMSRNEKEVLLSVNALRHIEFDLLKATPDAQSRPTYPSMDEDEADATLDGPLLYHLEGEVAEVGIDELGLGTIYDLQASSRKSKNSISKNNQKPHKKAKVSKSPIFSR